MFPQSEFDKVQCLESLVGIRSACSINQHYPFFVEDIPGIDIQTLASTAQGPNLSGVDYAKQIINSASRKVLSDIELLLNNGYRLKENVGDMCSSCSLLTTYTPNSGIIVKSNISSRFKTLHITKLQILCDFTGMKQITIDDGVTPVYYSPTFEAGVISIVNIDYSTTQKQVKIFFTDNTVGLGRVSCATPSSCGCGKSSITDSPVTVTGLLAGVESTTQYGFVPCAAVGCSYEQLICGMINQTPNIFGMALLYKIGEEFYLRKEVSQRNNETVSFNEEEKVDIVNNYAKKYWATLQGSSSSIGVKHTINRYLENNRKDRCVICDSKISISYATG